MATKCEHEHDHGHEHELEFDAAMDPTLASCCERDQQNFDRAMKLKTLLTAHDPTSQNVRMRQQLFQPPAAPATTTTTATTSSAPQQKVESVDSDSDFDDSDDEFGMEAVLAVRRAQLQQQMQQQVQDAKDGYGVVLDVALSALVQELQSQPEVPRVVMVVDSHADTAFVRAMRSEMAAVAQRYVGTKFNVASASTREEDVLRQLRLSSVPGLAAFRHGERVDSVALDASALVTELDVLWEARFLPWLAKCSVLASERQASQNSRSRSSKQSAGDEEEPSGFDCGVEGCRLRFGYEHEHVGTSQDVKDEIAAWRT